MTERWFPRLDPPPGGAQRLARALAAASRPARRWRYATALVAGVAVAAFAIGRLAPGDRHAVAPRIEHALHAAAGTADVPRVNGGALVEAPSTDRGVRVFLVMSAAEPAAAAPGGAG